MMNRRKFLLGGVAASAVLALSKPAQAAHAGVTVGAIRWDAYYGPSSAQGTIRRSVEFSLSPLTYQSRAPACATANNTATSAALSYANCSSQAAIDAEITAASNAGIDYWAYCWYGATNELNTAWNYHQTSTIRNQVKFSLIYASSTLLVSEVNSSTTLNALLGYFTQSNYQSVTIGGVARPLLYLLTDSTATGTVKSAITSLRSAASSAGVANPYIIGLVGVVANATTNYGFDAIGTYYTAPIVSVGAYADLVTNVEAYWTTLAQSGMPMIPTAVTGSDFRPRRARPHQFMESGTFPAVPFSGMLNYTVAGTPSQIASHVGDMVTWMKANTSSCPAQTGLIYSWNEHDEGGSALNPGLGGSSSILNAVAGAL